MPTMPDEDPEFANDLLRGAQAIAVFLFGKGDAKARRRVYHLANSRLPVFKLGAITCARKSTLLEYVKAQEQRQAPSSKRLEP